MGVGSEALPLFQLARLLAGLVLGDRRGLAFEGTLSKPSGSTIDDDNDDDDEEDEPKRTADDDRSFGRPSDSSVKPLEDDAASSAPAS